MIHHTDDSLTAVDVIRCVYLARVAEKRGDQNAAQRWQAKADAWLQESAPPTDLSPPQDETFGER
jgi:hypothetical protein